MFLGSFHTSGNYTTNEPVKVFSLAERLANLGPYTPGTVQMRQTCISNLVRTCIMADAFELFFKQDIVIVSWR